MTAIERLRALEKKWRLEVDGSDERELQEIGYDACLLDCADELSTLIAELGQEVGAVADSRRPLDAALAIAFWDARKTINESPDWVTPVEVIHWGDEIVRNARRYGTQPSPAHTSEARDAARYRWLAENAIIQWPGVTHIGDDPASTRLPLDNAIDAAMRQEGGNAD